MLNITNILMFKATLFSEGVGSGSSRRDYTYNILIVHVLFYLSNFTECQISLLYFQGQYFLDIEYTSMMTPSPYFPIFKKFNAAKQFVTVQCSGKKFEILISLRKSRYSYLMVAQNMLRKHEGLCKERKQIYAYSRFYQMP